MGQKVIILWEIMNWGFHYTVHWSLDNKNVMSSSLCSCPWISSRWWFLTYFCISCFCLNALLHIWHTCGCLPVWMVLWFFRAYELQNEVPQMSQGNGRSSQCILERRFDYNSCMCLNTTLYKSIKFWNTVQSNNKSALNGNFSLSQVLSDPKTNVQFPLRNVTYLTCNLKVKSRI